MCWGVLGVVAAVACGRTADRPDLPDGFPPNTPAAFEDGEAVFDARCASCHGEFALGTDQGPPLVHPIYRRDHHADPAFLLAVRRGVRAHHWTYGDMPPVPEVTDEQLEAVVRYVRWLQRAAGIT